MKEIKNNKPTHLINEKIRSEDGSEFSLCIAREADMDNIKRVYYEVYGGNYTLPEVTNSDKMKWAIHDPNFIWLLMRKEERIVGSVLFVVDPKERLGKSLAGAVLPEFRGHNLMKKAIKRGLDYVFYEKNLVDAVYGVVRTFVPMSFHKNLKDLGFIDVGIFPNVRKISKYETHGLKVAYRDGAVENRKKEPHLIEPAKSIYDVVRLLLNLEEAECVPYEYVTHKTFKKYEFYIEKSPEIEWEYYRERDSGKLLMSFYPFHYPEIKLYTKDKKTRIYLHYEERDGHGDVMGIATNEPENLTDILENVAQYAESIGVKYLELLINAFDPEIQKRTYEADFIPCAYFPAMKSSAEGGRIDFIVSCRNFVPLDFKEMKLTDDTRAYVRAYFKLWTEKLWKDLEHA